MYNLPSDRDDQGTEIVIFSLRQNNSGVAMGNFFNDWQKRKPYTKRWNPKQIPRQRFVSIGSFGPLLATIRLVT